MTAFGSQRRFLSIAAKAAVLSTVLVGGGPVLGPLYSLADQTPAVGTVVNLGNLQEHQDLLGPGLIWAVEHGVNLKVGAYRPIEHPAPVREATAKYASKASLSTKGKFVENYVAGLPFPKVDASDPDAAIKHMFNYEAAIETDDLDVRNFDCDTGSLGSDGDPIKVERHFLIDHFRRLYFTGRLEIDPKPVMEPNQDAVRFKEALYPLIEPFDLKGTGFTFNRYLDHKRHDDSWLYLPQLRRVRRLSSAQRSDALFGQDTDQDSYGGYAGSIAWMNWTLLGEKPVLASFHAEHLPVVWGEPSGDYVHGDLWEPREAWVIEGASTLPQYAYSKRVIYLDKESYFIAFSDIYDTGGELWKLWINEFTIRKAPIEGAAYVSEHERRFFPSISMVDVQLAHATYCSLPTHRFPGEQGWYVNVGPVEGTVEDYFELSAIISAGR